MSDVAVTRHALERWTGRCGKLIEDRDAMIATIADAVANGRDIESHEIDDAACCLCNTNRHKSLPTAKAPIWFRNKVESGEWMIIVNKEIGVGFFVKIDNEDRCPYVVTCFLLSRFWRASIRSRGKKPWRKDYKERRPYRRERVGITVEQAHL